MYGFILCCCCVKYKQIWGPVAEHFFEDFLISFPTVLVSVTSHSAYSAMDRETALSLADLYLRDIIIYLIPTVIAVVNLRKVQPTDEPFGESGSDGSKEMN